MSADNKAFPSRPATVELALQIAQERADREGRTLAVVVTRTGFYTIRTVANAEELPAGWAVVAYVEPEQAGPSRKGGR